MSDVKGKTIIIVAGDLGGWNAFAPVAQRALQEECIVRALFVGTCAEQIRDKKLAVDPRIDTDTDTAFIASDPHDLLVACASQSDYYASKTITAIYHSDAPYVIIEDTYGSARFICRYLFRYQETYRPRKVCVIDEHARDLLSSNVRHSWKDFAVTGGPQFDASVKRKTHHIEDRKELRRKLGLFDARRLFIVVGGVTGTADMIVLLSEAVERFNRSHSKKIIFPEVVIYEHHRASGLDRQLLNHIKTHPIRLVNTTYEPLEFAPLPEDLIPAADFVLSPYSTVNYHAILYGLLGTIYVGTPSIKWQMREEKGFDRWPTVDEKHTVAAWYVETSEQLEHAITETTLKRYTSEEVRRIKENQAELQEMYVEEKATDKVWGECVKLMTQMTRQS